jgi:hypothetical protein
MFFLYLIIVQDLLLIGAMKLMTNRQEKQKLYIQKEKCQKIVKTMQ